MYTYTYLINVHAFWHTSCAYVIITHILYIYIYLLYLVTHSLFGGLFKLACSSTTLGTVEHAGALMVLASDLISIFDIFRGSRELVVNSIRTRCLICCSSLSKYLPAASSLSRSLSACQRLCLAGWSNSRRSCEHFCCRNRCCSCWPRWLWDSTSRASDSLR